MRLLLSCLVVISLVISNGMPVAGCPRGMQEYLGSCYPVSCDAQGACLEGFQCQPVSKHCTTGSGICRQFACIAKTASVEEDGFQLAVASRQHCTSGEIEFGKFPHTRCVAITCDSPTACPEDTFCIAQKNECPANTICPQYTCTAHREKLQHGTENSEESIMLTAFPDSNCERGERLVAGLCIPYSCKSSRACGEGEVCKASGDDCVNCTGFKCVPSPRRQLHDSAVGHSTGRILETEKNSTYEPGVATCPSLNCTSQCLYDIVRDSNGCPTCDCQPCPIGEEFYEITESCSPVTCASLSACKVTENCFPTPRSCDSTPCKQYTCEEKSICPFGQEYDARNSFCTIVRCPMSEVEQNPCSADETCVDVSVICRDQPCVQYECKKGEQVEVPEEEEYELVDITTAPDSQDDEIDNTHNSTGNVTLPNCNGDGCSLNGSPGGHHIWCSILVLLISIPGLIG